jgi:hypothetical protein
MFAFTCANHWLKLHTFILMLDHLLGDQHSSPVIRRILGGIATTTSDIVPDEAGITWQGDGYNATIGQTQIRQWASNCGSYALDNFRDRHWCEEKPWAITQEGQARAEALLNALAEIHNIHFLPPNGGWTRENLRLYLRDITQDVDIAASPLFGNSALQ